MFSRCLFFAVIVTLLAAPAPLLADQLPLLRELRATGGGSEPRVELVTDRPVAFTSYTMAELRRAVIDLPGVEPAQVKEAIPVGSGMIDKITVRKKLVNEAPLTRVIIHLQRDADVRVTADPVDPRRIVALLRPAGPAPAAPAAVAPKTPPSPQPAPPLPSPVAAAPAPSPRPSDGRLISIGKISVTSTGLEITADATLADFHAFTLKEPHRLVIDIPRAKGAPGTITLPANPWGVLSARTGNYADKVRIVFDRTAAPFPPYKVEKTAGGLKVTFSAPAAAQQGKPLRRERQALHE